MDSETVQCQCLITRLPYAQRYRKEPILAAVKQVDARGLIFVSCPISLDHPANGARLVTELEDAGLVSVALVSWHRDRHIVASRSRRLTNTWELVAVFGRQKNYHINRDFVTKIKRGYEGRESAFEEDDFTTCVGDFWPARNDRRDRRYLPARIVLNAGQLADLHPGDRVLDPYGNPGIRDAVQALGWQYSDGGAPNPARSTSPETESESEHEANLPR